MNLLEWQSDLQLSVDASTEMSVRSRIGLDPSDKRDKEYIVKHKIDEENDSFTKCVRHPCPLKLVHGPLMGEEGQIASRADVLLKAAIPSFDNSNRP